MLRKFRKFFFLSLIHVFFLDSSAQLQPLPGNIFLQTIDSGVYLIDAIPATQQSFPDPKKVWLITGTNLGIWTASFIILNKAWYADYKRSSFHVFNDNKEWNQMDKAGHVWTNYHISSLSANMWKWTGLPYSKSLLLGAISGIAYQSLVEIQDGYSREWGFSWGDMGANVAGAVVFLSQEFAWKEQRMTLKFSYAPYQFPQDLTGRRNQIFGESGYERILKDYNSQTYWISGNIKSFFKTTALPPWLNIAAGYGSSGMLGGTVNRWTDKSGETFNRMDIHRLRRFYLSPDVDLTKIKTNRKWIRTVFYVVNVIKIPAPAIEINSKGKFRFHAVKW